MIGDGAHSFGASQNNKKSGSVSDFTCFSFHAVKNLTTAEGGAVTWRNNLGLDDQEIYQEFMLLSLHGQSKDALAKSQIGSWEYDIVYPGYKNNMTDISASIGLVQLERYSKLLKQRRDIINKYNLAFESTKIKPLQHFTNKNISSGHLYITRIEGIDENKRNKIIVELAERGISTNVHYKPLPMFTAYKQLGFNINNYPNAFDNYKNSITLPLHTKLSDDEIKYIIESIIEIVED